MHQIPKLKCISSPLTVVCAQSIETSCLVENEDVVGAVPTGDAPTTSEWSIIVLPYKVFHYIRGFTVREPAEPAYQITRIVYCLHGYAIFPNEPHTITRDRWNNINLFNTGSSYCGWQDILSISTLVSINVQAGTKDINTPYVYAFRNLSIAGWINLKKSSSKYSIGLKYRLLSQFPAFRFFFCFRIIKTYHVHIWHMSP